MTRARFVAPLLALALLVAAPARAATWEIDPAHTTIQFSVRHMMVSNVRGHFGKFSGHVDGDETAPTKARIEATIETASIDTGNPKRDDHLRSADFLDAAKFPTITFKSTKVEQTGASTWKVTGDLSLHGVTHEVVLELSDVTKPIKDPMGAQRAGGAVRTTINRQDFGITYSKALEGGGVVVGNEITITIDVEVTHKGS